MRVIELWLKYIWAYLRFRRIILEVVQRRYIGDTNAYYDISPKAVRHFYISPYGVSFLCSFSGYIEKVYFKLEDVVNIESVKEEE